MLNRYGIEAQDLEYRYKVTTRLRQRADFILKDKRNGDACILEIQGGGETSSTKILTDHVVNRLIEYGVRDEELFSTEMISLEER